MFDERRLKKINSPIENYKIGSHSFHIVANTTFPIPLTISIGSAIERVKIESR